MKRLKISTPSWVTIVLLAAFVIILLMVFGGFFRAADSDKDGIYDEEETQGYDIIIHYINGTETIHVSSNPNKKDTDDDGLNDFVELLNSTNPMNPDTDDDGLTDYEEIVTYGTNPLYQDQDDDKLKDGIEVNGWDVTLRGTTTHVTSNVSRYDTDFDFFTDLQEYNVRTDPNKKDTDGDNVWDSTDVDPLWNIKVTVDLINFTLLKSGAAPYFIIYAYDNYTVTPTVTVNYNETVSLDDAYDLLNADIYDDLGGDTFNVRISALDKNSQTEEGRDASLAINGSNYVWQINYNITNPQQVFSLTGNDGVLEIKIMIIRE